MDQLRGLTNLDQDSADLDQPGLLYVQVSWWVSQKSESLG